MSTGSSTTGASWRAGLPPGVYERIAPVTRSIDVKMDVAAFVGLTERGPIATATAVDSWSEFQAAFGRCGGGRQTPDAVFQFFANGGRRAVVSRAIHYAGAHTARFVVSGVLDGVGPLVLYAHDPGVWGNDLRIEWWWRRKPLLASHTPVSPDAEGRYTAFDLPTALAPAIGAVLRSSRYFRQSGVAEQVGDVVVTVEAVVSIDRATSRVTLSGAIPPATPAGFTGAAAAPLEEVRGRLLASHGMLTEDLDDIALDPRHPDALATRLAEGRSRLLRLGSAGGGIRPPGGFAAAGVWTSAALAVPDGAPDGSGVGSDDALATTRDVYFVAPGAGPATSEAAAWAACPSPLDALDGYDAANEPEPVSLVCLPDLLHPLDPLSFEEAEVEVEEGTRFGECHPLPAETTQVITLDWPLLVDPAVDAHQAQLVAWCEARPGIVAILDLPPRLTAGGVLTWRNGHASFRVAAYAPYLRLAPPEDPLLPLRTVPPCGAVCGLIARQERRAGVHIAPANLALAGIAGLAADPLLPEPGFLHETRVNLIRATERGLRLLGSRTTSFDEEWTHLSVRRTLDWLERQIRLDCRWATFEPNNTRLWRRLVLTIEKRLRTIGAAGAWAGATPEESWFVRCDASTHTQADLDNGRAVALVGVAPAVPAEFLVFQITLQRDGEVVTEATGG